MGAAQLAPLNQTHFVMLKRLNVTFVEMHKETHLDPILNNVTMGIFLIQMDALQLAWMNKDFFVQEIRQFVWLFAEMVW